jgi:SMC interacting uncharacterized protein involved in chromosome segregation
MMKKFSDISQLIEQIPHISQNDLFLSISNLSGEYENANKMILDRLKKYNSAIFNIPGVVQSVVQDTNDIFLEGMRKINNGLEENFDNITNICNSIILMLKELALKNEPV